MSEWSPFSLIALAGVCVLLLGWIGVVILEPSPRRTLLEWLSTTAMYVALGSWFLGLSLDAWAEDRTALLVPFGFLAVLFCAGFCVSLYRTLAQLGGGGSAATSATN